MSVFYVLYHGNHSFNISSWNRSTHHGLLTRLDVNCNQALLPVFELENQTLDDLNAVKHFVEVRLLQVEQLLDILVVQDLFLHGLVRLQVVDQIPDALRFVAFGLLHKLQEALEDLLVRRDLRPGEALGIPSDPGVVIICEGARIQLALVVWVVAVLDEVRSD